MLTLRWLFLSLAIIILGLPSANTRAQDTSDAPLHLIVPFAAGGPSDLLARKLGEKLGERLKRPVVVDNRAGGGGSIAAGFVARAEPDGNTILWSTSTIAIDPVLRSWLPYNVQKDLTPIVTAMFTPLAVLVNPQLPVHNIAELVAYAKAHPGKLNFGSGGVGTSLHLATERFMLDAGIKMVHVPYKGASQSVVGLIANDIQLLFNPMPTALQYGRDGKLRAIAVTTSKRSSIWPELPTVAESGLPGLAHFDADMWYALYAPAKTPKSVIKHLNKEIIASLDSPDMKKWLHMQGMEVLGDTPEQARKRLASDIHMWSEVVRHANIKLR